MSWLDHLRRRPRPTPGVLARDTFDLMCVSIAIVVLVHAPHLPWWLGAGLLIVLGLRWWQHRRQPGRAPAWLKLPLIVLLTAGIVFSYGNLFGRGPGAALAVGLLVLKLLESGSPRDARVAMAFACFTLMAALLFDQGLLATIGVALGLLPALAALRSLEPARAPLGLPRQLLPGLLLLLVSLPLTLFAFALVPRLGTPLWGTPQGDQARTGLSDRMSPGDMTDLLVDDSPAMRVAFDGAQAPPPAQRYFRAYVMTLYDGRTWQAAGGRSPEPASLRAGDSIGYTVTLEPTGQRVLPALDVPLAPPAGAWMTRERVIVAERRDSGMLNYHLRSALHYSFDQAPGRTLSRYLQLPAGYNPRTLALGREWRARYGDDVQSIVQAALAMFHDGGFSYTLAAPPLGRDAMDDFLFSTRAGFCEHYASSFTLLMRAAGIPARVVTGYQGGYWSELGDYLLVRQSDAHAWSEVWIKDRGWIRVDPTAAVRPERVDLGAGAAGSGDQAWYQRAWIRGLRNSWDIVNRWWDQGVIGFNALRQQTLLQPFGIRRTDTRTLALLLIAGSVLFAVAGLAWAVSRRRHADPVLEVLRTLERKLARAGVVRRNSEGPRHFLMRAARALPQQKASLRLLMEQYLQLRYGGSEPASESLRQLHRAVRDFRVRRVVK